MLTIMAKKQSLFEVLYTGLSSTIKTMKKPLVERSISRRFDAFSDGCDARIDELEMKITTLLEHGITNPEDLDIQQIAELRLEIKDTVKLAQEVAGLKKELFSESIETQE
jgi:hypothetical protein